MTTRDEIIVMSLDDIGDLLIDADEKVWVDVLDHREALHKAYQSGRNAGLKEAAEVCEGGSFLHDDAPDARFGKACAAAIRARIKGNDDGHKEAESALKQHGGEKV